MQRRREEGIGLDELAQATRNHGMPLEALRYDITPTGLHYLLIHYDIPLVDPEGWRLELDGFSDPMRLSLDELRARSSVTAAVTLECAGNGRALADARPLSQPWLHEAVGTSAWTGTPLAPLLREAGVPDHAVEVVFEGADRGVEGGSEAAYERSLPLDEALRDDVLVVHEMNGLPLLPQHGAPLRLVVPGWYGMAHVKWLRRIRPVSEPFVGRQQTVAYRMRTDPTEDGVPLTRIRPRSLMAPPGVPSFPERERLLDVGPTVLEGRAWSGVAPIVGVEVSTDGGLTWSEAEVEPAAGPYAWHRWTYPWNASAGRHALSSRATDASGESQPPEPQPNLGGYANNAVQSIVVTVAS